MGQLNLHFLIYTMFNFNSSSGLWEKLKCEKLMDADADKTSYGELESNWVHTMMKMRLYVLPKKIDTINF